MLFEEIHVSRAAKIENAIVLARLHDGYGLRTLTVEGYLTNGPPMDLHCLRDAAAGLTALERAEVVGQLLRSFEVGTTTALLLIYDDLRLYPTESATEFNVDLAAAARSAMTRYLLKIAERAVRPEHLMRLSQLQREIQNAPPEQQPAKGKAALDYLMSLDPFAQEKYKRLSDMSQVATLSLEAILKDAQEIEQRARSLSVSLSAEDQEAMRTSLAFWRGRLAANRTMADNTGYLADQPKTSMVALNLGAAHTLGVADRFAEQRRPFVVIRPLSLNAPGLGIDLDLESINNAEQTASIFSEGIIGNLLRMYPVDPSMSEPVCNRAWVQAEMELFFFARRIAGRAFTGPERTLRAKSSEKLAFRPDEFRGRRVNVDPNDVQIISDTAPASPKVLLFRARLKSPGSANGSELWVKLGVTPGRTTAPSDVETVLVRSREAVRREPRPGKRLEDARGRVLITDSIRAAFAPTREAAIKVPVGEE